MAADATFTTAQVNEVGPSLALTTSQKQYDIVRTTGAGNPTDSVVLLVSDVAWWFSLVSGGNKTPVAAGERFPVILSLGTTTCYVKTQSGTGTLYANRPA